MNVCGCHDCERDARLRTHVVIVDSSKVCYTPNGTGNERAISTKTLDGLFAREVICSGNIFTSPSSFDNTFLKAIPE